MGKMALPTPSRSSRWPPPRPGEDGKGKRGEILRAVVGHSIALALMVGAIVWIYAHLLPGLVVSPSVP